MKGIVLAGGTGSRLFPLTKAINKHLLPVGDKPMIFHPIEKLVEAKITDIIIVTGTEHMGSVVQCLGSGKDFGCTLSYKVQDEAGGIAQALGLCRSICYGERICIILGDNIFEDSLHPYVQWFQEQERGARVLLKDVDNKTRYGVAFVRDNKINKIIEKPKEELLTDEFEHYAVTGVYFYDQRVFEIVDELKPSNRGELEISDVNNAYLGWGELQYSIMEGFWNDAGTLESFKEANKIINGE